MPSPSPAPYYLPLQFAPLAPHLRRGLPLEAWAEEQFALEVGRRGLTPGAEPRAREVLQVLDALPLQVKDVVRGLIDRISLEGRDEFAPGTLATWHRGSLRVNVEWADLEPLRRRGGDRAFARHLLRSTFAHECGHALVEDRRGGVPLRDYLRLLAASGWLPDPGRDPLPFRSAPLGLDRLTEHYLQRLRWVDPRWRAELPLAHPDQPRADLDRALVDGGQADPMRDFVGSRSIGLASSAQVAKRVLASASEGRLAGDLARWRLSLSELRAATAAYPPVSPYADDEACEVPAEIFRCLQVERWSRTLPALEEGRRLLVAPWRRAELQMGPRRRAPRLPARRVLATAERGRG